jgi:hypothetical protein
MVKLFSEKGKLKEKSKNKTNDAAVGELKSEKTEKTRKKGILS